VSPVREPYPLPVCASAVLRPSARGLASNAPLRRTQLDKIHNLAMRSSRNWHGLTWQDRLPSPLWLRCRERAAIDPGPEPRAATCFRRSQGVRTRVRTWSPEPCAQVRILLGAHFR
jgi:hypothetical protein